MEDFIVFNSLNFFSLMLLVIMYVHTKFFLEKDNAGTRKVWLKVLFATVITQTLDIACWYLDGRTGQLAYILSEVLNVVLFTFCTILTMNASLFIKYSVESFSPSYYKFKKVFTGFVIINFLLSSLSVPFDFIFSIEPVTNIYSRSPYYFVMLIFVFLPLVIVLGNLLFTHIKSVNKILRNNRMTILLIAINIVGTFFLNTIQSVQTVQISALFPFLTLSIFIIHIMIVANMVSRDALTGVKNSFGLKDYFYQIPKVLDKYLTVVFFDLDNLKATNDVWGHREGDQILQDFSNLITNEIKNRDLFSRIGGDEFVLVMQLDELKDLDNFCNNIKQKAEDYNQKTTRSKIMFSYGASYCEPNKQYDKDALIDRADKEMYKYKQIHKQAYKQ
ncbi:MAG: GGDEF domain-containing protein [Spirochaetales bacterium]